MPAHKKRKKKTSPHRSPQHQAAPAAPPVIVDRRLMEQGLGTITRLLAEQGFATHEEADDYLQNLLAESGGKLPEVAPRTPLEEAQEVIYQALEKKGRQRLNLARKALDISPDCADAYVLLAEGTKDPIEARRLYEQGMQAGERAIGSELFADPTTPFWGYLPTRPYMRAREGLADVLWFLGEQDEAIGHYRELLRLNPNDNQGIRYKLLPRLLTRGDDAAARKLLDQYKDEFSASWAYARALLLFRRYGQGKRANRALLEAIETNPFVPIYLLGLEEPPKKLPELIEAGSPSEAVEYLVEGVDAWLETPGALEWLAPLMTAALAQVLEEEMPDLLDDLGSLGELDDIPGLPGQPGPLQFPRR